MPDRKYNFENERLTVTGGKLSYEEFVEAALVAEKLPRCIEKKPDLSKPVVALRIVDEPEDIVTINTTDGSVSTRLTVQRGEAIATRYNPETGTIVLGNTGQPDQWRIKEDEIAKLYEPTGKTIDNHGELCAGKNIVLAADVQNGVAIDEAPWGSPQSVPDGALFFKMVGAPEVYCCDKGGLTSFSAERDLPDEILADFWGKLDEATFENTWRNATPNRTAEDYARLQVKIRREIQDIRRANEFDPTANTQGFERPPPSL